MTLLRGFVLLGLALALSCRAAPQKVAPGPRVERPLPAVDDPAVLFAGCSGAVLSERSVLYRCGAILASVADSDDLTSDALLGSHVAGFKASARGRVVDELDPLTLLGKPVLAVRVSVFPLSGGEELLYRGHFAGVTLAKRVRVVSCGAKGGLPPLLERCGQILAFLAARGPPPSVEVKARATPPSPGAPTILGRPLTVPEGCSTLFSSEDGARLKCDGAELSFRLLPAAPRDERLLDELVRSVRSGVKGEVKEERIDCRIEGAVTFCRRLAIVVAGAAPVTGWLGVATVKGVSLLAQCSYTERGAGLDPICNSVFELP